MFQVDFLFLRRGYGEDHIPCDDGSQSDDVQEQEERDAGEEEDVLDLIVFPSPVLEFQCKHRNLGNQQITTEEGADKDDPFQTLEAHLILIQSYRSEESENNANSEKDENATTDYTDFTDFREF